MIRFLVISLTLVMLLTATVAAEKADETAKQLRTLKLTTVNGQPIAPFADSSTKAVALIFVAHDCPVANAFQPSLAAFHKTYAEQGVVCIQVHCSSLVTADAVKKHVVDFVIKMPVVCDPEQKLGRLTGAKVTPEAIVIDRAGTVRYRGAINNLYAGFGKKRRVATSHYLQDAVDAVLAGETVKTPKTKPVGCFIHYAEK
jgi:thiol-disulfide isomerase/thioredoxin